MNISKREIAKNVLAGLEKELRKLQMEMIASHDYEEMTEIGDKTIICKLKIRDKTAEINRLEGR